MKVSPETHGIKLSISSYESDYNEAERRHTDRLTQSASHSSHIRYMHAKLLSILKIALKPIKEVQFQRYFVQVILASRLIW